MQLDHLSAADRSDGKLPGGRRRWRSAGRAARACMLVTGRAGPGRHRPGLEVAKAKGWVVDLDRLPAPVSARRFPAGRKSTRVCAMTCLESGWTAARARAAVFFAFAAASIALAIGGFGRTPSIRAHVRENCKDRCSSPSHAAMLRAATLLQTPVLLYVRVARVLQPRQSSIPIVYPFNLLAAINVSTMVGKKNSVQQGCKKRGLCSPVSDGSHLSV